MKKAGAQARRDRQWEAWTLRFASMQRSMLRRDAMLREILDGLDEMCAATHFRKVYLKVLSRFYSTQYDALIERENVLARNRMESAVSDKPKRKTAKRLPQGGKTS